MQLGVSPLFIFNNLIGGVTIMNKEKVTYGLYAVTSRTWESEEYSLLEQLEDALIAGVNCVQLREKGCSDKEYLSIAEDVISICHMYDVPCIINDNIKVAIKSGADGVHIGQGDGNSRIVREKIGEGKILGVTVKTVEQALEAERNGADYLGTGAVFATSTKNDTHIIEHSIVRDICSAVKIPVLAIGGINEDNIDELKGLGVSGVAVVSGVFGSKDIQQSCKNLKERVKNL